MNCGGCKRELNPGDRYIRDTPSGFIDQPSLGPELEGLMAEIFCGKGDEIVFCEDCTEPGGKYAYETYIGDAWKVTP